MPQAQPSFHDPKGLSSPMCAEIPRADDRVFGQRSHTQMSALDDSVVVSFSGDWGVI